MKNRKLFVFALFISILIYFYLHHPRPTRFWENGRATAHIFHIFDQMVIDPNTGEIRIGLVTVSGSAAVVDKNGLIITNSHVVDSIMFEPEDAPPHNINILLVCKITNGNRECDESPTIVEINREYDLAMLKTTMKFDQEVKLYPNGGLKKGDEIYFWGNVNGIPMSSLRGHYINRMEVADLVNGSVRTFTNGKEQLIKGPFLMMDLRVGPGSSGGPMFDSLDRSIGITSMITSEGPSTGYIIPSITIAKVFPKNNWPKVE